MIRRCMGMCLVWVVGLLVAGLVPTEATELRRGNVVTIGPGQVVDDDLVIAAQRVVVEGTVRGDLIVTANSLRVPGRVTGNLLGLTQSLEVPGTVDGSLRAATQIATIAGQVGRNLSIAAQNTTIARGARINRDAHIAAQSVELNGAVGRQAGLAAQSASIGGTVGQHLRFDGNNLTIDPAARIGGDLLVRSPRQAEIAPGATIAGQVRRLPVEPRRERRPTPGPGIGLLWFNLLLAVALFIVGSIGLALAPRFLRTAADQLREKPGWSILWGILLFIVVPIAALVVGFTIVGIPLSLLAWALWGFAVLFAAIPVALFLGREFTGWLRRGAPLSPYANLAIGLALIALVAAIPVVWLFVWLAVVFFGVGMFALAVYDLMEQRRGAAPA
ncbi:MAG TPA: hypothetical protein PLU39_11935 [Armatimonadota bacterium]|jgi:cytoskeletal protein CcmA (bactofilin family)/putative Mn2+ efflux pump MntP|nr:hypothetical protein [Armatimonadota bacterium]HOM81011.1 hypothetical protein [Armatimonadota bacterium]HPO72664.1 hypothetical protein [Armatimonadota bacterium]HPT98568.1 hypothetical protein [Armatimonadota bacterium]